MDGVQNPTSRGASKAPAAGGPIVGAHRIVCLFKCARSHLYCLTSDRSGANIPKEGGRRDWVYVRDVELVVDDQRLAIDSTLAMAEVDEYGYYLVGGWYVSH